MSDPSDSSTSDRARENGMTTSCDDCECYQRFEERLESDFDHVAIGDPRNHYETQ